MQATINQPLTNVQLELLKTFSYDLSNNDIICQVSQGYCSNIKSKLLCEA